MNWSQKILTCCCWIFLFVSAKKPGSSAFFATENSLVTKAHELYIEGKKEQSLDVVKKIFATPGLTSAVQINILDLLEKIFKDELFHLYEFPDQFVPLNPQKCPQKTPTGSFHCQSVNSVSIEAEFGVETEILKLTTKGVTFTMSSNPLNYADRSYFGKNLHLRFRKNTKNASQENLTFLGVIVRSFMESRKEEDFKKTQTKDPVFSQQNFLPKSMLHAFIFRDNKLCYFGGGNADKSPRLYENLLQTLSLFYEKTDCNTHKPLIFPDF